MTTQRPRAATAEQVVWRPNPGPQTRFLACGASEALYGGAAGGGKSAALIALPLRWIANPRFRVLYLRREATYLGDAVDKASALYPKFGARLRQTPRIEWIFPSGARIWFSHCEHESDVRNYDSFEFQLVLFDELTHFTERQWTGICARIRGTDPTLPRWARAATNPGGDGHEWVFRRWGPWLDPSHKNASEARPGKALHFIGDEVQPGRSAETVSRTFIPAKLADNPHVEPEYRAKLAQLDPVRRAQLERGDWLVKPAAGLYFKRAWVQFRGSAPERHEAAARVRYWDLAAGGDWAVGARLSRLHDRRIVVEHIERLRGQPGDVRARFAHVAEADGPEVVQWIEQDPGQAGKDQIASYQRDYPSLTIRGRPKRVDKVTAFGPFSSACQAGNVAWVSGTWVAAALDELEAFPEGDNDDQADALSGAYSALVGVSDADDSPPLSISSRRR